ncbi:hypothetical protein KAH81_00640 [bacterium]|nr:hypothetical protein [bacterium]
MKKGPFYRRYIRPIKHMVGYWIVSTLVFFLRAFPRSIALWKASILGNLFYFILKKDRNIALKNIAIVFPDLCYEEKKTLARDCFRQTAMNLVDTVRAKSIIESEPRLWEIEGEEYLRDTAKKHNGAIVISGHIGCFELLAGIWTKLGVDVAVVGRKLYDERIDRLLVKQREDMGVKNIASDAHPKKVLSMLKSGCFIGTLIDTNTKSVDGQSAPFFGREVRTISAPAGLTRLAGAALLPMAIYRKKKNRFVLRVWPPIESPMTGDKREDIRQLLIKANRAIETMILHQPNQWIWYHDRFGK